MITLVVLGLALTDQALAPGPCAAAAQAVSGEARARLFAEAGRFARTGESLKSPAFGIREALDGVAADRAGNDRYELEFETRDCLEGVGSATVSGLVVHAGWSNEPATGERYPSSFAAPFVEEWRLADGRWRIAVLEVGRFSPRAER